MPCAQALQDSAPVVFEKYPASQAVQVEAAAEETRPTGQSTHTAAPISEYFPAAQASSHVVAPAFV